VPATVATSTGYICTAAGFGPELRIAVESPTRELVFFANVVVGAAGVVVRIVNVGSVFYVLYQGSASTTVSVRTLTISSGTVSDGGTATLVTLNNASSTWDASNYDGTNWFLVYGSGATTVTLAKMAAVTASATVTFASTDNLTFLSVWADAATARIWVGLVDDPSSTATVAFRVYTATPALSVGPTTLSLGRSPTVPLFGPLYTRTPVAGDAFGVFTQASLGSTSDATVLFTTVVEAGTVTLTQRKTFNVVPISKPDVQQRVWCMTYVAGSNFTETRALLLRFEDAERQGTPGGPSPIVELASPSMETPGSVYHPNASHGRAFHAVAVTSESAGGQTFFAFPFVLTSRTNASAATEPMTRVDVYEYTRWNQEPHRQMVPLGLAGVVSGQPTSGDLPRC
jgi:hypothetical protein